MTAGGVSYIGGRLDQADDALGRRLRHLHLREPLRQLLDGLKEMPAVGQKGQQGAGADAAPARLQATKDQRQSRGDGSQRQHQRQVQGRLNLIEHRWPCTCRR